ncbi:MAG: DUF6519 domain-containing protein [Desulfobacterales bacterium]|nr:DUF6519 domain-containing protein [Desulfobacterales bacterium]
MKGDFSRNVSESASRYSSVRMQQGRVQLDADWNEQVEISERLRRAALGDIIGHCCVPQSEPLSFRAGFTPEGPFGLRRGRIWIDGLLCQSEAPYIPDLPETDGRYAVYMEVRQRHVTIVEDPDIGEVALGGADTTTRTETIWRVGFDPVAAGADCSSAWNPPDQTTGELTAGTAADPNEGPCVVPTGSGYTRLENQLYRVEVHHSGTVGSADPPTFKWSRENAWPLVRWLETDGDELVVTDLGRDEVVGLYDNRWIELEHDQTDFSGEPGPLVEVIERTPDADGRYRLRIDAHGQSVPDAQTLSQPKIRRWDQDDGSDPNSGAIEIVAGTPVPLEGGIEVTFADGFYRAGDHWFIPARTFGGEEIGTIIWPVDEVSGLHVAQPPHGVERRYCRIAYVNVVGGEVDPESIEDCRHHFPSLCGLQDREGESCCTVVVQPGEDIQAAIDILPPIGGCVCLKTGLHLIDDALRIESSNVHLHGETPGTRIRRTTDGVTALMVRHPAGLLLSDISITNIQFEFDNSEIDGSSMSSLLMLDRCEDLVVRDCRFIYQRPEILMGVIIGRCERVCIERCEFRMVLIGIWVYADSTALCIKEVRFAVARGETGDEGLVAIYLEDAFGPSQIKDNRITGYIFGIALNSNFFLPDAYPSSGAAGSTICRNRIFRTDSVLEEADTKAFAIDVAAADCLIAENTINFADPLYGGIRVTGNRHRVTDNIIRFNGRELTDAPAQGILAGFLAETSDRVVSDGCIIGNRLYGPQNAIIVYRNEGEDISDNRISSTVDQVGFGIFLAEADRARVNQNRIENAFLGLSATQGSGNRFDGNDLRRGAAGMTMQSQNDCAFRMNHVEEMRNWGFIGLQFISKTALAENRFIACGFEQVPAIGVALANVFGELVVESCQILNTGISPDGATVSQPHWALFGVNILDCRIQSNLINIADPALLNTQLEDRSLWLRGLLDLPPLSDNIPPITSGFSARVLDNKFVGTGRLAMIEIPQLPLAERTFARFNRVSIQNNVVTHFSPIPDRLQATVKLAARYAIVMGNHIAAFTQQPSVDFQDTPGIFMGNITHGGAVNFTDFPNPETDYNL